MAEYNPLEHGDIDIVFAGGGTAACVTAGRLAKNNPDLKILLIEGGANSFDDPTVRNPALYLTHLAPESKSAIFYKSSASKYLNDREAIVPAGGILGGGSAINFLMYTRAQGIDFDTWDAPGWAAKDMIPLCKKLETFHQDEPGINKDKHGYDGPIHVSDGGFRSKSEKDFISTIEKMGMKEIVDLQDFDQNDGWSRWQRYASKDGKRQDAAYRYLYPLVEGGKHPNLFVLVHTKVVRVLFDTSGDGLPKATGVEYQPNPTAQPQTQLSNPVKSTVKAKLVVVSSGALGSPQILERSGIGNPAILKQVGVPLVAEVPGVGENYQDHNLTLYPFKSSLGPEETLDGLLSGRQEFSQLSATKDPILGWNAIDICCKIQMTKDEVEAQSEQFQKDWNKDFADYPTRPLMLCGIANAFLADASLVDPGQYITFGCYTAYPWSTGSIHIKSANDVLAGYDFDAGFFSHPSDVNIQVWGYKKAREIARRLPYCTGEVGLGHPVFQEGSGAKLADSSYSASVDGDIKYSPEDDAVIEDWVRGNVNTTWHSLGTCAMKSLEKGGVVDTNLNVHGTSGLKVVDLSIVPTNVGANTNNTALAVGEKAANIIAADLGLAL